MPFQLAERPGDQKGSKKEEKLDSSLMVEYSILREGKSVQAHNGLCNIYNVITKETPELTSGSHTPAVDDADKAQASSSSTSRIRRSFHGPQFREKQGSSGRARIIREGSSLNLWYDREISVCLSPSTVNSR